MRGPAGIEVELADGEEGVAPGQACAFYDAGIGQARMLGGGFIRSATPRSEIEAVAALRLPPSQSSQAPLPTPPLQAEEAGAGAGRVGGEAREDRGGRG